MSVPGIGDATGGPSKDRGSGYARVWNAPDDAAARKLILNVEDTELFDRSGRYDFDRVAPYFTEADTVLDLGCGIGRVAEHVAKKCRRLWAVDVSSRMLELAQQRMADVGHVSYVLCEGVTFPTVPSGGVDFAYSFLVLQHVEREDAFLLLEELHRILRPGGWLIVTYPNLLAETYLTCFVNYARSGLSLEPSRARPYTEQEVRAIMPAAGFEVDTLDVGTELYVVARSV
jgi:ubiquinone/menaquinone biosynthesis C-methylase UbiE